MKKLLIMLSLAFVTFCSLIVPVYGSTKGATYNLPVMNSCGFNNDHYLVTGTFTVNGTIDFSKTTRYYMSPGYVNGAYHNGGYIYIYTTTTGQIYVPYDDGYTNQNNVYYTTACSVWH
ncbi:MAG: hypothetical protein IKG46_11880 [Solobacterium sp.]|nr:hypothetical protein [Solobacterium sp.]